MIFIRVYSRFLPAGFFYARYHALPGKLPKTNTAKFKIADIASGPAAKSAAISPAR
jgi:hypothetical protein